MMILLNVFLNILILGNLSGSPNYMLGDDPYLKDGFTVEAFSHKDLLKWESWGKGIVANGSHGQLILSESDSSKGIMILSPKIYGKDVILSYDLMSLRPATVCIVELLAHNTDDYNLKLPEDYDGNVEYLFKNINMYMFTFLNAAHNKPGPFIRKYPEPGTEPLVQTDKQFMQSGIYYHVELGKIGSKLFLKIDDQMILETTDANSFNAGKIILRIRGTAHEVASCLIRNVKIYSRE